MLALGPASAARSAQPLEPNQLLDAFGRLGGTAGRPGPPLAPDAFAQAMPGPPHPPGLYAPVGLREAGDAQTEAARSALNLQRAITELAPLGASATGGAPEPYARAAERDLAP